MAWHDCLTDEMLSKYITGSVDPDRIDEISSHIERCEQCELRLDTIVASGDTIQDAVARPSTPDPYEAEDECRAVLARIAAVAMEAADVEKGSADVTDDELPAEHIRDYRLVSKLGQGGMGAVYQAVHTRLDKVVALKILPADRTSDAAAMSRFQREMKAVGQLEHPNLVRALDAGEEDGQQYLVLEYVDGLDLSTLAKRTGPMPVGQACELIRQAAIGLQYAADNGLVHRDIKPSNLMLTREGTVKILDLGLALLANQHTVVGDEEELTSTGQVMGTLDYMAPEQGTDAHNVDIRCDIYSLGGSLYRLLSGQPPYSGERFNTPVKKLMALANEDVPALDGVRDDLPAGLVAIVHRMLSREPGDRFVAPRDVADVLAEFSEPGTLPQLFDVAPVTEPDTAPRTSDTHPAEKSLATTAIESQPVAEPLPAVAKAQPGATGRRLWITVAIMILAGGSMWALWDVTFRTKTEHGTLYVQVPDGVDALVSIDSVRAEIDYVEGGRKLKIKVKPGTHNLVVQTADGLTLDTESRRFNIAAGANKTVRAWFDPHSERSGVGYALDLTPNGYVFVPDLEWDGGPFTFELWFTRRAEEFGIFVRSVSDAGKVATWFMPEVIAVGIDAADDTSEQIFLVRNPCYGTHHLAFQWDGEVGSIFIDGKLQQAERRSNPHVVFPSRGTTLAADVNMEGELDTQGRAGVTDEVRISSGVRYTADFTPQKRLTADETTLALYHFDEGEGGTAHDSSRHGRHGEIVTANWITEPSINHQTIARQLLDLGATVGIRLAPASSLSQLTQPDAIPDESFWIQSVDLARTAVEDADLAILQGLPLRVLNLHATKITDRGLGWLRDLPLTDLSLQSCPGVSDAGCTHIAQVATLLHLRASDTSITNEGLQQLATLPALRELGISGTKITDLTPLAEAKDLQSLDLFGLTVTDDDLKALAQGTSLLSIRLSETDVTGPGLVHLKDQALRDVGLSNTNVSDSALRLLEEFRSLQRVDVRGTQVTAAGVARLKTMRTGCQVESDLSETDIAQAKKTLPQGLLETESQFALDLSRYGSVHIPELSWDGGPITVEGMFNRPAVGSEWQLIFNITTESRRLVGLYHLTGGLGLSVLSDGQWSTYASGEPCFGLHHIAFQFDGSNPSLFVDGRPLQLTPPNNSSFYDFPSGTTFGCSPPDGTPRQKPATFYGTLDDVRISKVKRYESEFVPPRGILNDAQTIASYALEAGNGNTIVDGSGGGFDGTTTNTRWTSAAPRFVDHRAALRRILALGGSAVVWHDRQLVTVAPGAAIPSGELKIETANLSNTQTRDADLNTLKYVPFHELQLQGCPITDEGVSALAHMPLNALFLINCSKVTDVGMAALQDLRTLHTLRLEHTSVGNGALELAGRQPHLTALNIGSESIQITNDGLRHLTQAQNLHFLDIGGTAVTDAGIQHLAGLDWLDWVNVSRTNVSDASLRIFEPLQNLGQLRVDGTRVTVEGVARASLAHADCEISSDFSQDEITAAMEGLGPDLNAAFAIRHLGGSYRTSLQPEVSLGPGTAVPVQPFKITQIDLGLSRRTTDADLAKLEALTDLISLDVPRNPGIGNAGVIKLCQWATLNSINLGARASRAGRAGRVSLLAAGRCASGSHLRPGSTSPSVDSTECTRPRAGRQKGPRPMVRA